MKIRMLLSLLAAIAAASPAFRRAVQYGGITLHHCRDASACHGERPVNVTFQTRAEGVKISESLKSKYPDEMTIILQNRVQAAHGEGRPL